MKKKMVTILLSLTLSVSMVVQVGAGSVDWDITSTDELCDSTDTEIQTEETPVFAVQQKAEDNTSDVFLNQSYEEQQGDTTPQTSTEDNFIGEDILSDSSDSLSAGESDENIVQEPVKQNILTDEAAAAGAVNVDSEGAIIVGASDWIKVPQGWKLVKNTTSAVSEANALQENEQSDSLENDLDEDVISAVGESVEQTETADESVEQTETADESVEQTAAGGSVQSYYTAVDGIVKINTTTVKGSNTGYYLFDEDGIMVSGRKTVASGTPGYTGSAAAELYFTDEAAAKLYPEYSNVAKTPVTSDIGQQKKNYWLYENGKFRLYGVSGNNISVKSLNEKYKNQGYLKINGEYYCLKDDGTPRIGEVKINGSMYYFEPDSEIPGRMFREGWKKFVNTKGEKWVYYNRENKGKDRGKAVKYNGNVAITISPLSTTTKYLLDHNGYILKSRRTQTIDGAWYGSDAQGRIYKNKVVKYGSYRYYFTANGKQVGWKNMWKQCPGADNRFYYFGSTPGRISEKTGWQRVTWPSGKFLGWFYFADNGEHYRNTLASDYYFDKYGKLASGVTTVNGKTYFFEISSSDTRRGKMFRNTLITYNGNWYYAEADGQLANNTWKQIDGSWYRFENYVTQKNTFRWMGNTYGYLDAQGKFCTGWIIYSNAQNLVRYVNPNGGGFYTNTSAVIDGLRYYFDSNGYRINDLTSVIRGPYYVKVDRVNGLMTIYDSTGTIPVKSVRVSVGAAGTPTPLGTYTLRSSLRWQPLMGPSYGQYGVHVQGAGQGGIFIHSVPGARPNVYSVPSAAYNMLGNPASHGCIRVCVADCKWVYEHCNGARITIYDGAYKADEAMKGPLGRRALEPMRYPYNFDPTDPAI